MWISYLPQWYTLPEPDVCRTGHHQVAKFDFSLTFIYDSTCDTDRLSCIFQCSHDLFDETSVAILTRRFKHLLEEIFSLNRSVDRIDTCYAPISTFDVSLPEEFRELEVIVFCRQANVMNEGMYLYFLIDDVFDV